MSSPCSKEYWEKVTLEWLALSAETRARYNDLATSASDAAFSETVAALALLDDAFCNSRGEQQEPRPPSYLSPWIEWGVGGGRPSTYPCPYPVPRPPSATFYGGGSPQYPPPSQTAKKMGAHTLPLLKF